MGYLCRRSEFFFYSSFFFCEGKCEIIGRNLGSEDELYIILWGKFRDSTGCFLVNLAVDLITISF